MRANDRQKLASEVLRLCKRLLVESMSKSSALSALFELHPRLSDGRILNRNLLDAVMEESGASAQQTVAEPFAQLEQALASGSDPQPALRKLLNKLEFSALTIPLSFVSAMALQELRSSTEPSGYPIGIIQARDCPSGVSFGSLWGLKQARTAAKSQQVYSCGLQRSDLRQWPRNESAPQM
jgi:hypothetical protein